jgi:uncharacterized membrane protein YgcG
MNHFSNGDITVSCQTTPNATCSTANPFATLTDGGTTTVALTVNVGLQAKTVAPNSNGDQWKIVLAGVLAIFLRLGRRRFKTLLGLLAFLALLTIPMSCGGGGGGAGGGGGGGGGSPQTTLSVSVISQATTATGILQISAGTLTITVTQ